MQERAIFIKAIQEDDPHKRAAVLDICCRGDTNLRQQVEQLLSEHQREESFILDDPPITPDAAVIEPFFQLTGTVIGRYELAELIGEGGFGVVYVAEQTQPVRRHVALKIIKPGMDSRQVLARFEAERQTLALMDHPHIAKILDGGTTDSGRPYFVMELVKGVPITDYCRRCQLGTRERLELFVSVCRAVQHAHQKGIIHRDLKPSNVLVEMQDRRPAPKIIDFGVAKATGQKLTEETLRTQFTQMIGTPMYMSPEQAELSPIDVDTRSDVYSLGAILYELLSDQTPYVGKRLSEASFDELRRIIREEEPPRPSARVSTLAADVDEASSQIHPGDSRHLANSLRGELDWIAMKALAKDRARRYDTAADLAADIERYLRDEPVVARPASAIYRAKKFAQRNRALAASMVVIAAALLAVGLVTIGFTIRSRRVQHETARRLYASQMVQAVSAWEDADYGSLENLLQSTTPTPNSPDFRGWEWYYLDEQARRPFAVTPETHVWQAAWHPRMNQIAVIVEKTEEDSAIEVWEPGNRLPLRIVAEIPDTPAFEINGIIWSANGNRMAFTTMHGRAVVLDADTGATLFDQQVHAGAGEMTDTFGVDLSPTADVLATGSWFGQIKTWDINRHELIDVILDPDSPSNLRCVAFSPDGDQLAATLRYGARAVWDLRTKARFDYDPVSVGSFGRIQWCADGRRFAATDNHKVAVYERDIAAPIAVITNRDVRDVCWVDDDLLASGGTDQTIRFWDLRKLHQVRSLQVDRGPLWKVFVSPDGQFLAATGTRGLRVVRLTKRLGYHNVLEPAERQSGLGSVVRWSSDGERIAVKHSAQRSPGESKFTATLRIQDVRTSRIIAVHDDIGVGHLPMIDWSADDTFILDIDYHGRRYELGVTDPDMSKFYDDLIQNSDDLHQIAVSHESGFLAVAAGNEVRICEAGTMQARDSLEIPGDLWSVRLAWSPDDRSLLIAYVVNRTIHIHIYDMQRKQTLEDSAIVDSDDPVLAWDPTSTRVALGTEDAVIHIWNVASLEQDMTLVGHGSPIQGLAWSPNGTRIASCANDGTVRIWDSARGDQLAAFHLPGEPKLCSSVDWSPDGRQLAIGGASGEVYVMDAGPSMPTFVNPRTTKSSASHQPSQR